MGIFATHRALASLSNRFSDVEEQIRALQSANRSLELDFEQLYDKVRHQMSRMAKRAAVDTAANGDLSGGMDDPAGLAGLDPISAKIHARRNAGKPNS